MRFPLHGRATAMVAKQTGVPAGVMIAAAIVPSTTVTVIGE
jgi:hypothetical protein